MVIKSLTISLIYIIMHRSDLFRVQCFRFKLDLLIGLLSSWFDHEILRNYIPIVKSECNFHNALIVHGLYFMAIYQMVFSKRKTKLVRYIQYDIIFLKILFSFKYLKNYNSSLLNELSCTRKFTTWVNNFEIYRTNLYNSLGGFKLLITVFYFVQFIFVCVNNA